MSQRELGEILGVRQQQIARWEATNYRTVDLGRVDSVANALGVTLDDLTPAAGLPFAAEAVASYGAAPLATAGSNVRSVRDLGEIAARIRAHGDELRDRFHVSRIGVFGSFAYGEQTPRSDVDLLVAYAVRPAGLANFALPEFCEGILGRKADVVEEHLLRDRLKPRVMKDVVYVWTA